MNTSLFRKGICCVLGCLLMLLALPFVVTPATATRQLNGPDVGKIDAFLQSEMRTHTIPGLAVGLVHGNQIAHLRGFGVADPTGRAVTSQTPFIIGSASKSFTALAIMQLVEAGKIRLDAPVQQYLPWFRVADATTSAHITVRHLLNQNSGLQDPAEPPAATDESLEQYLHSPMLDRPVGSTFEYANVNYVLLGQIVEAISGETYTTYVTRHLFVPLEMHHSFASVQQARQAGLAQGYTWFFGTPLAADDHLLHISGLLSAGLLASTVEDMSHYLIAHMNGGRYGNTSILSSAGIATLHAPAVAIVPDMVYGMGWVNDQSNGVPAIWHDGDTDTFHALMLITPQTQWGAILLVNSNSQVFGVLDDLLPGMTRLLTGQESSPTRLGVSTFYLISDILLAIISVLVLVSALRLPWWYRRTLRRTPPQSPRVWWRAIIPLSWEIVLPAGLLLGIPLVLGASWPAIVFALPDLGWASLTILTLWLLVGAVKIFLRALLSRRSGGTPPLVPSPRPSLT